MSSPFNSLRTGFWKTFAGLVMVDDRGRVRLTERGVQELVPRCAVYGLQPLECKSLASFLACMTQLHREEAAERSRALAFGLRDPSLSPENRRFVERMLVPDVFPCSPSPTAQEPSRDGNVIDLSARRRSAKPRQG